MKRLITFEQEKCWGCPFLKYVQRGMISYYCEKAKRYSGYYNADTPVPVVEQELNVWFETSCPFKMIK